MKDGIGGNKEDSMSEERHYSVQEIAAAWGTDSGTIRRYFINEEGVEKIACSATRSRYLRWRLSIPEKRGDAGAYRLSSKGETPSLH